MRKSNRWIVRLIAMVAMLTMLPLEVFAATENPYEQYVGNAGFTVSSSFCQNGQTTRIFVDISENSQMSAGLFTLSFNTEMLKAVSVETGVALRDGITSRNIAGDGSVRVAFSDVNPHYEAGRMFEVELEAVGEVPEGASYTEIPVTLTVLDLRNYEDYKIASTVRDGKITLINEPYGDVNLSGDTTATDALLTLCANSELVELTDRQKKLADVNGDGKVSAADALLILQYSAGEISNYPIFALEAPTGLSVDEKDETFVSLKWDEAKNVIGYNLYMDEEKMNEELITQSRYTVTGLKQDTQYGFRVQAVNCLTESKKSDLLTVSTNKADRQVVFQDYDGRLINTQVVLSGTAAVLPEPPTRKGYTFIGWDGDTDCILTDTVFTAQYRINTYSVNFDYLYDGQQKTCDITYGELLTKPEIIEREDYTLEGWYRDKNFIKKWDFAADVVEDDTTLYANWVTWSEWTTDASLKDNALYEVETKTQYAYSDKDTDTSTSPTKTGWTPDSSLDTYGAWTNVDWTKTKPTTSETLQITNTKTETDQSDYTIYHYYIYRSTDGIGFGSLNYNAYYAKTGTYHLCTVLDTLDLTYRLTSYLGDGTVGYAQSQHPSYSGKSWCTTWFENGSTYYPAVTHTEWYYQTRTKYYGFYKWSAYSEWSDTKYVSSSTREVKTRTLYRYKLKQQ